MVAKNLFRPRQAISRNQSFQEATPQSPVSPEQKLAEYEEQLSHLSQQKELHTLALKEMYQFLCKMDTSFREENQKLRDLIEVEQARSSKLIEVTKGLWDIVELIDDGKATSVDLTAEITKEVRELAKLEVEILDESTPTLAEHNDLPKISDMAPMMEAVTA